MKRFMFIYTIPGSLAVKNPPANSRDTGYPLEKGMATHCSIPAWEIRWTDEQWATVLGVTKELDMA